MASFLKLVKIFSRSLLAADLPNPAIPAPVLDAPEINITGIKLSEPPAYTKGQTLATREAYGNALVIIFLCEIKLYLREGNEQRHKRTFVNFAQLAYEYKKGITQREAFMCDAS